MESFKPTVVRRLVLRLSLSTTPRSSTISSYLRSVLLVEGLLLLLLILLLLLTSLWNEARMGNRCLSRGSCQRDQKRQFVDANAVILRRVTARHRKHDCLEKTECPASLLRSRLCLCGAERGSTCTCCSNRKKVSGE